MTTLDRIVDLYFRSEPDSRCPFITLGRVDEAPCFDSPAARLNLRHAVRRHLHRVATCSLLCVLSVAILVATGLMALVILPAWPDSLYYASGHSAVFLVPVAYAACVTLSSLTCRRDIRRIMTPHSSSGEAVRR
ncbi:hypothetical protein B7486_01970 [cyanobacterium TDX16]|nr:hypothetical protein B7486_01970 [cyanobacterium TDX16]